MVLHRWTTESPTMIIYAIYFIFLHLCINSQCEANTGTNRRIREIFIGKCYEFQETRKNIPILHKDCYQLVDTFGRAVKLQHNCSSKTYSNAFDEFFKKADPGKTPVNKAMFWTGTKELAEQMSTANDDFIILSQTLPGYIANGLTFCGGNPVNIYNFTTCSCSWPSSIEKTYLTAAAKQFARNAQGTVSVLLNGSRTDGKPAYWSNSIFAQAELPNINPSQVHKIRILVGWDPSHKPRESCGHESIKKLQNDIEQKKIKVECVDNPRVVLYTLCAMHPDSSACKSYLLTRGGDVKKWRIVGGIFIAISVCLLIILMVMIFCNFRKGTAVIAEKPYGEKTSLVKA